MKRSGALFRQRWGEQITGNLAIGGIFVLVGLVPAVVLGVIGWNADSDVLRGVLLGIAIVLAVAAAVLARTVGSVFSVALYRFAAGEGATGPFTEDDLRGAVRLRRAGLA